MGECPDNFRELGPGRPGLFRVRVYARNRRPEEDPADPAAPEQYRVLMWPVQVDAGFRSLYADDLPRAGWTPDRARAAAWALPRLVALAQPDPNEQSLRRAAALAGPAGPVDPADPAGPAGPAGPVDPASPVEPSPAGADRVLVRRRRSMPAAAAQAFLSRPGHHLGAIADGADLVLSAGPLRIRLSDVTTTDGFSARWRWDGAGSGTSVPDGVDTTVGIRVEPHPANGAATTTAAAVADVTLTHDGVRASDAILLGMVWDYLLEYGENVARGGAATPLSWTPVFRAEAAEAATRADASRRRAAAADARRWGGTPPVERLRQLSVNVRGLSRLDRPLLDALAEASPESQRALARWAAREACTVAGLATIDWIASGLAALDRGEPLPPPFDDQAIAFQRLLADGRVPSTTVTIPSGTVTNQQAIALPAVHAAAYDDPLAAAVDTVFFAALAYGENHRTLLRAATKRLGQPGRSGLLGWLGRRVPPG